MNKTNVLLAVLVLCIVGLLGMGVVLIRESDMLKQTMYELSQTQTQLSAAQKVSQTPQTPQIPQTPPSIPPSVPQTPPAAPPTQGEGFNTVKQISVNWKGQVYNFLHRCLGEVKAGQGSSSAPSYCVGDNQLVLHRPNGEEQILQSGLSQDSSSSPVLSGVELLDVMSDVDGTVLISYGVDSCVTTNDCGAGMNYNRVSMAYNLRDVDSAPHVLVNYPGTGWPTWQGGRSGTKAIFVPDTCGGAGCDLSPLYGYNLDQDKTTPLTSLGQAAGVFNGGVASTVDGKALPVWQLNITWKNDSDFTAQILQTDHTLKTINGTF